MSTAVERAGVALAKKVIEESGFCHRQPDCDCSPTLAVHVLVAAGEVADLPEHIRKRFKKHFDNYVETEDEKD